MNACRQRTLAASSGARNERGNPAAHPEPVDGFGPRLVDAERRQLVVRDATGKRLRGLPQQVGSGTPEHEEPGRVPRPVHQHAQQLEEPRLALHLVDDDESPGGFERQHRIREPRLVGRVFEIEGRDRLRLCPAHAARQRRLANLPRTDESDDRKLA